ncbi:MAG: response regulator [bacterium]|nr:response regulator [bacterium]
MREKILVVDDSQTVVEVMKSILEESGFEVITASDGIEAITKVYKESPSLIFLDIMMPRISGYQVCRLIKADEQTQQIPIIMLTSKDDPQYKLWGLHSGADRYITKTEFDPQAIIDLVEEITKDRSPKRVEKAELHQDPIEILSSIGNLLDRELYRSTMERIKLESIINNVTEGLITIDDQKKITNFNQKAEEITGYKREEVGGKVCKSILKGNLCEERCIFEEALSKEREVTNIEMRIKTQQGTEITVLSSLGLLRDTEGKIVGGVEVFRKI